MNTLSWIVDPAFAARLTLALLHFLWQGCCGGLLVIVCGTLFRDAPTRLRYVLNVAVLILMAVCLPVTFLMVDIPVVPLSKTEVLPNVLPPKPADSTLDKLPNPSAARSVPPASELVGPNDEPPVGASATRETSPASAEAHTSRVEPATLVMAGTFQSLSRWVATLYLSGVALILARLLRGVWGGRRLRRLANMIDDAQLLEMVNNLARRLGLQVVPAVAWCGQISIPVVVGIVKPMILLPLAVVSGLTPHQLQALVLHELAHIRRFDPIVNLLQRIIEAVLFFHPVVWFVSRRISVVREHAADDMVLAAGWDRPVYADALVRAAELATAFTCPDFARRATVLGASGTSQTEFKLRVLRLLDDSHSPKLQLSRAGVLAVMLIVALGGMFAWSQADRSETASAQRGALDVLEPKPDEAAVVDNQSISLADAVRDFNRENRQLGRGLDQPALTEEEVIGFINRSDKEGDAKDLNDREFAAFKAVAESKRLPQDSYLQVDTEEPRDTFILNHLWHVRLMLPAIGHDGFVGLTIRDTKIREEKIDAKSVAWGKPDPAGLSLGLYLSPKKSKYQIGERIQLRLFVRNDSQQPVGGLTFMNVTWPKTKDFTVTDPTGANVAVRNGHEEWSGAIWVAGASEGALGPGDAHALRIPFELGIGGDGSNKLVGRVIDARAGQTLQVRVRAFNGNDSVRDKGEPEPESGSITLTIADAPDTKAVVDPNGEIVGRLIDIVTGKPVAGATVACGALVNDSGKGGGANAVTDAEGIYRLLVPSPGIYNVWLKTFDKDPAMTAAADDGILVEPGKVSPSQLYLIKARKVGGKVVDEDGNTIANLSVQCYSPARLYGGGNQSALTNADGTFELRLPPGRAHIYVSESVAKTAGNPLGLGRYADAFLTVSATDEFAPIILLLKQREFKFGDPEWLSRSTSGTQIVRHTSSANVAGTVVDVSGHPIPQAKVFGAEGPMCTANEKGEFLVNVDIGTQFPMHAFAPGYCVWFGIPAAGDELKIVLEKKSSGIPRPCPRPRRRRQARDRQDVARSGSRDDSQIGG